MKQRIVRSYLLSTNHLESLATVRARAQSANETRISDSFIVRALINHASKIKVKELSTIIDNEIKRGE